MPTVLRMRVSSTRPAFGIGAAPMDMSVEMSAVVNKSAGLGLVHVAEALTARSCPARRSAPAAVTRSHVAGAAQLLHPTRKAAR